MGYFGERGVLGKYVQERISVHNSKSSIPSSKYDRFLKFMHAGSSLSHRALLWSLLKISFESSCVIHEHQAKIRPR